VARRSLRLGEALVAGALLVLGWLRLRRRREREPVVPPGAAEPGAELVVLGLLLAGAACAIGFIVVYALDRLPHQTQLLGACLGLAFLFVAAALVLTGRRLVVSEELEEDYPAVEHEDEQQVVAQIVADSGSRLTRKRLLKLAVGLVGGSLGLALITPAVSLGPIFDVDRFYGTPWRRGRRLVDEQGRPYRGADIEQDAFYTAFPEGANREDLGASIAVVRLPPARLDLPPALRGYDADGIVAYSKICTHAGCAISLYRAPLFQPNEPPPGLVCPCHYSTFDPAAGGTVTFGPAGRALPMLPIYVDRSGFLRARHNFDEPVGPSWWGVRMRKPSP
jgi:ubiquinol-cytochrome c reductase iron-sulfur subunit